jgi:hypothetical protein
MCGGSCIERQFCSGLMRNALPCGRVPVLRSAVARNISVVCDQASRSYILAANNVCAISRPIVCGSSPGYTITPEIFHFVPPQYEGGNFEYRPLGRVVSFQIFATSPFFFILFDIYSFETA